MAKSRDHPHRDALGAATWVSLFTPNSHDAPIDTSTSHVGFRCLKQLKSIPLTR
jgi:hypothetical protein